MVTDQQDRLLERDRQRQDAADARQHPAVPVLSRQTRPGPRPDAFRRLCPIPTLSKPDPAKEEATAYLQKNPVVLNWYPKIQAMKSGGVAGGDVEAASNQAPLTAKHIAFLDLDRLHFELERFKAERGWYNLNLSADGIAELLADQSWYQLLIPAEELACDSFEKVRLWEEIALSLLKKFSSRLHPLADLRWETVHRLC